MSSSFYQAPRRQRDKRAGRRLVLQCGNGRRRILASSAASPAGRRIEVVRNGRIRQSLAYWCLNATHWNWDIHQVCQTACRLGCRSVELVPAELWPVVRQYGLENAIAHNGMPDPVFAKGLNNPRYRDEVVARTKHVIDQCADGGVPNVIAFTGFKWR